MVSSRSVAKGNEVRRLPRMPVWMATALALLVSCVVFLVVTGFYMPILVMMVGNTVAIAALAVPVISVPIAYFSFKKTFGYFRWKKIPRLGSGCWKCGYNLTGNVSGVCPECGTPIDKGTIDKG